MNATAQTFDGKLRMELITSREMNDKQVSNLDESFEYYLKLRRQKPKKADEKSHAKTCYQWAKSLILICDAAPEESNRWHLKDWLTHGDHLAEQYTGQTVK